MSTVRPEFIRLPESTKKGGERSICSYTGYSRTGLYNLCVPCKANNFKPAVPAKCDRKPGNLRGVWLIPYGKLIDYINNLPTPGLYKEAASETNSAPAKAQKVEAGPVALPRVRGRHLAGAKGQR